MKYLIFNFGNDETSGGQIVIYEICKELQRLGNEVLVSHSVPGFKTITQSDLDNQENSVTIYPEIVPGNPFNSKNIVRWILYHVRPEIENTWSDTDVYFKLSHYFNAKRRYAGLLFCFDPKLDYFEDKKQARSGVCHILRNKPIPNEETIESQFNSVNLNPIIQSSGLKGLNDAFNQFEYFVTYDDATYYSVIASLCGCKSVVLRTSKTPERYKSLLPVLRYGVAFGFEQVEQAEKEKHLMRDHLKAEQKRGLESIREFNIYWRLKLNGNWNI